MADITAAAASLGITAEVSEIEVGAPGALPEGTAPETGGSQTPPASPDPIDDAAAAAAGVIPLRHVWASYDEPTLDERGNPVNWEPVASGNSAAGYIRTIIEGIDLTVYQGVHTPMPTWVKGDPFGSQSATITLPQVSVFQPLPDIARFGANVSIEWVPFGGGETTTVFDGFVMSRSRRTQAKTVGPLVLSALGSLFAADLLLHQPTLMDSAEDIGSFVPRLLNAVSSKRWLSVAQIITGIKVATSGASEPLLTGGIQSALATAVKGGRQYTLAYEDRQPTLRLKDVTTQHYTLHVGQPGVTVDLREDASQAPNVLYATWTRPDGGECAGWVFPHAHADTAPIYPMSGGTLIVVGTRDSDTTSGTGVSDWQREAGRPVTGRFSSDDSTALRRMQKVAGITVDGILGQQSWAMTFATGSNTGSLEGARRNPIAFVPEVMPLVYGPRGDNPQPNPVFDPDMVRVEKEIVGGRDVETAQITSYCEEALARDSRPWHTGTITLHGVSPQEAPACLMDAGENTGLKYLHGQNLLLHHAQVKQDPENFTTTLHVDEGARDYPTLQAIQARARDARDAGGSPNASRASSRNPLDSMVFDAESPVGVIPRVAINGGYITVLQIPMLRRCSLVGIELKATSPASKYSFAFFSKPVTAADILGVAGNPMTTSTEPWSGVHAETWESMGLVFNIGWTEQPGGYYPGEASNVAGATGATVTGRVVSRLGVDYETTDGNWGWAMIASPDDCYIEGRIYARRV